MLEGLDANDIADISVSVSALDGLDQAINQVSP